MLGVALLLWALKETLGTWEWGKGSIVETPNLNAESWPWA